VSLMPKGPVRRTPVLDRLQRVAEPNQTEDEAPATPPQEDASESSPSDTVPPSSGERVRQGSEDAVSAPAAAPASKKTSAKERRAHESFPLFELDTDRYPTLNELCRNLTLDAARGKLAPIVGREHELEQTLDVLAKRHANSAVLVGPAGVGKTALARALALRFAGARGQRAVRLLVELPVAEILAGTAARGSLAERLQAVREEVVRSERKIVLFIDGIEELLSSAGDEGLAELKAGLASGDIALVSTTTPEGYRRYIDSDASLDRRFTRVDVEEQGEAETLLVLGSVARDLAIHHRVAYSDEALAVAVSWSIRYVPGRALPDKAISVLDLAGARVARRGGERTVDVPHVADVVAELVQVPAERLLESDGDRMLRLGELLAERVVGHRQPLERIATVLRRNAAGLRGRRPIGSFLLLGPTGVGKTETAKAIAEVLFHNSSAMTRLDLSEYSEAHAVARLIGAPPGYVGHDAGGALTEAARKRPYQVVLLDEIEKAHRDVLESFLQVFDEGRLTDGRGRTVDFCNTVIVMTSNLGAEQIQALQTERRVGFAAVAHDAGTKDPSALEDAAIKAAKASLPPELYNRIDEVMFFQPLSRANVRRVARRLLEALSRSLAEREIQIEFDDDVLDALLDLGGYDVQMGARPMRRAISRLVEAPLAELLLRGELPAGATAHIRVSDSGIDVAAA